MIALITEVREHFGAPVHVTSGYRCPDRNKKKGGASRSFHLSGQAADFYVERLDIEKVYDEILEMSLFKDAKRFGLICYPDRGIIHLDPRAKPLRVKHFDNPR